MIQFMPNLWLIIFLINLMILFMMYLMNFFNKNFK